MWILQLTGLTRTGALEGRIVDDGDKFVFGDFFGVESCGLLLHATTGVGNDDGGIGL